MTLRQGEDRGALLENMVFLHLRRQGIFPSYYLTASGQEVDFIWKDPKTGDKQLAQVCWEWDDPTTRDRELSALRIAMKETGLSKAIVVTWLDERDVDVRIKVIPAWRYLLQA